MPKILPISDLRNNFNTISETCHKDAEAERSNGAPKVSLSIFMEE